jgi:RimJ/RimL family protein N-acetyltransferase
MPPPSLREVGFTPIGTERLLIRLADPTDVDDLHHILSRPDVCRYLLHPPLSVDEVVQRVARFAGRTLLSADRDAIRLAITRRDSGRTIGELVLIVESAANACLEIGWVLDPDHQGKGFAAEGARALLGYAIATLGAHRVVAQLHPDNTGSAGLCARLGMRQEAHHRADAWVKGAWEDTAIYAILDHEWRP